MNRLADANLAESKKSIRIELLAVLTLLLSFGFPGNLTQYLGKQAITLLDYGVFILELVTMFLSSGRTWLELELINLDRKYLPIYLFLLIIFVDSMLVTRYPTKEFTTCTRLLATALFAVWLQDYFTFDRLLELFGITQAIFLLFTFLYMLLNRGGAFESGSSFLNAFRGLMTTKNNAASELSFGIICTTYLILTRKADGKSYLFWGGMLAVQAFLLLLCQATGPMLSMLLVLSLLLIPPRIRLPLGWLYASLSVMFLYLMLTMMPLFAGFFESIGKDATLTSRIPLWNRVVSFMMEDRTLTGYGYAMFWNDPKAVAIFHSAFKKDTFLFLMTTGAHNSILELWLNIGLIGVGAHFISLIAATSHPEEIPERPYQFSCLLTAFLLITGLTERIIGITYQFGILSLFLVMALCCNRPQKLSRLALKQMQEAEKEVKKE